MDAKLLFIDDDPDWRVIATTALTDAGYEVVTAQDASDAM
jgi:DNA-binding NtrC family response regulator